MSEYRSVQRIFLIAALYQGLLGLLFLFFAPAVFNLARVTPPNHWSYVHFPAALLIIFGLMFAAVAGNPRANRNLIGYGILLKLSFCGVVVYHWSGLPWIWKPFALADAAFIAAFVWAIIRISRGP